MARSDAVIPKRKHSLQRVRRILDHEAAARGEPGLTHSFVASLATAVDCAGYVADPTWMMGASGFAFRIWVEDRLMPDAMNGFDWEAVLPEATRSIGFQCSHIHRLEQEMGVEAARRAEAHEGIVRSIDRGVPAIVWDPSDPPMWGLITGYNDHIQVYDTVAFWGYSMPLSYSQLGRRDVNRLSVLLLGDPIDADEGAVIRRSLESALLHARGREGRQVVRVQSGLAAYDRWASLLEPGALAEHEFQFADYTAEMFFSFRSYARDYLRMIAQGNRHLMQASRAYASVSDELREVHQAFQVEKRPSDEDLRRHAMRIRRAKVAEEDALSNIAAYLEDPDGD